MPFSCQGIKNGLIYAFVGAFIVGGLYGVSAKVASAAVIASQYNMSATTTASCMTGYNCTNIGSGLSGTPQSLTIYQAGASQNDSIHGLTNFILADEPATVTPTYTCEFDTYGFGYGYTGWLTGTSTSCGALDPTKTYYINQGFYGLAPRGDISDNTSYELTSGLTCENCGAFDYIASYETRFVSITSPANFATGVSTTTTFSGSYYLSTADGSSTDLYALRPFVNIYGSNGTIATSIGTSTFFIRIPVTQFDTIVSFSTTTTLADNSRYVWDASFTCPQAPDLTSQCAGISAAKTLSSGYNFFQFTTGNFMPPPPKAFDLSMCNPFSGFDAITCLQNIVVPDAGYLGLQMGAIKTQMATVPPWGYVTRIIDLMATSSTTTLPMISYTFQSDSPFAGKNITFDVGSYMNTASAFVNNEAVSNIATDHKSVWQIFMPVVNLFLYIVLAFSIFHDFTGIKLGRNKK